MLNCQHFAFPPLKNSYDSALKLLKNTLLIHIAANENWVSRENTTRNKKLLDFSFKSVTACKQVPRGWYLSISPRWEASRKKPQPQMPWVSTQE